MSRFDIHNDVEPVRAIDPNTSVGTTGTGITSKIIDRGANPGFRGVEFYVAYAGVTATNATVVASLLDGDVTGTLAAVGATGVRGSASLGQAATRTSGVSQNCVKRMEYFGLKRYVQLKLVPTVTAGAKCGAIAALSPSVKPAA